MKKFLLQNVNDIRSSIFKFILLEVLLLPVLMFGANRYVIDCSQSAIQNEVNSANDGDTIVVPVGNCTWSAPVIIDKRELILQGAGMDQTVITDNTASDWGQEPLWIIGVNGKTFRVTGFTFKDMKKRSATEPAILIQGDAINWRVDNCKFTTSLGGRGIIANGFGLIDHNIFENTTQGVAVFGTGDQSWSEPQALGTINAVYVEDNLFDYDTPLDGALDAYSGARYVFRYNTVINTMVGHHGTDSGGYRSTHSYERYGNIFQAPSASPWTVFGSRGGSGVDYNNTVTGNYGYFSIVINYRSCQSYQPYGICDGSNPEDGNSDTSGYPCKDQIGRTSNQLLSPVYEWNNTFNSLDGDVEIHDPWGCAALTQHIQENRDYYNDIPKPGYAPFTYPHPLSTGASIPIPPAPVIGGVYYVDNSGNPVCSDETSYGSEAKPWCTIGYALSRIEAGDDIFIKAGIYNEVFSISNLIASDNNHTVIRSYAEDKVEIRGLGVNAGRLKLNNVSYVDLIGVEITSFNQGLFIENRSSFITVDNCVIHNVGQEAIHIKENSHHITIQNSEIYDTRQWQYNGEGIYIGTGSSGPVDTTHDITIYRNTIHNTVDEAVELKAGTYNCIIDGNHIYNILTAPSYGAIEVNEHIIGVQEAPVEPSHVVKNNIIHTVDTAIRVGTSALVYNNIIYDVNSTAYGILVNNNANDLWSRKIYHNTIDLTSLNAIHISSGTSDVKNNIGSNLPDNIPAQTNLFIDSGNNDYHLKEGSLAIDTAIDLSNLILFDLDGNNRKIGLSPDYGAYEFSDITVSIQAPQNFRLKN